MKKTAMTLLAALTLASSLSQADCRTGYIEYFQSLRAQGDSYKTATVNTLATTAVVAGALVATGGFAAPLLIVTGDSGVVTFFRAELLKHREKGQLDALKLLNEAYGDEVVHTNKLLKALKKAHIEADATELKSWLRTNNDNDAFCSTDEITGQIHLFNEKQIFKAARLAASTL